MSVRKDIHAGFLGFYPFFATEWFPRRSRADALAKADDVMARLHETGIRVVDTFCFVEDWRAENRYISGKGPWKRQKWGGSLRTWDFDKPKGKFDRCYRAFCELLLKNGLRPCLTRFLRYLYLNTMWGNNRQGFGNISDPGFFEYAIRYNDRICRIEEDVFGEDYIQWAKFSNEFNHNSREDFGHDGDLAGHFVADFHRDLWDKSQFINGSLGRLILDTSHSDYVKAWFSQPSVCPKCGDVVYDRKDLRADDNSMIAIPELHGYSIAQNLNREADNAEDVKKAEDFNDIMHHARYNPKVRLHEDGGGGKHANGYAVGRYKIGDEEQSYEFAKLMWTMAKDAGKRVIYAPFPLETLVQPEYREDYEVSVINWERIEGIVRAYEEVYGK